ncbi:ATP-binding protein [Bradyrhizobium sp. WYCCWR 13023]|uniref:histidine kinase n=1 Tax=Bradyrhizobium zhengyangense TaxID=2911009 RepID=A0A9X1U8R5_9BRAD|nr:ATP-binding protein [Bradyrhizobium sp. CCBAU 11434]MCG2626233.1 ATP-binding protein [Bradyrhizobium zhengyangense]MCG2668239.1 ATP-binding protein [Bradyrhizobium zhengyangense]
MSSPTRERAAEIVDRIRAMATRGTVRQSEFELADIVKESMAFLQHEFDVQDVNVSLDLDNGLPMVAGDRTQLQQVLVNLLTNALQELTSSGIIQKRIGIRIELVDDKVVSCIIEDSGPGIDPEHLPHLFDSFFTTKESGMGLDLPIAQSIIESLGGRIWADNQSTLGGARFAFELPISLPETNH